MLDETPIPASSCVCKCGGGKLTVSSLSDTEMSFIVTVIQELLSSEATLSTCNDSCSRLQHVCF